MSTWTPKKKTTEIHGICVQHFRYRIDLIHTCVFETCRKYATPLTAVENWKSVLKSIFQVAQRGWSLLVSSPDFNRVQHRKISKIANQLTKIGNKNPDAHKQTLKSLDNFKKKKKSKIIKKRLAKAACTAGWLP